MVVEVLGSNPGSHTCEVDTTIDPHSQPKGLLRQDSLWISGYPWTYYSLEWPWTSDLNALACQVLRSQWGPTPHPLCLTSSGEQSPLLAMQAFGGAGELQVWTNLRHTYSKTSSQSQYYWETSRSHSITTRTPRPCSNLFWSFCPFSLSHSLWAILPKSISTSEPFLC